jgi:hypothetical protein
MGIHEPCQIRKEAALSGNSHVPQGYLGRANCLSSAYGCQSTEGARQFILKLTHLNCEMSFFVLLDEFTLEKGK